MDEFTCFDGIITGYPGLKFQHFSTRTMSWCLVNVYIHTLAALVWIDDMLFLWLAVVPIIQTIQTSRSGERVVRAVGGRFRLIARVCIGALLITDVVTLSH